LLETIEAYLGQSGHLTNTAKALGIHIATLRYRLERIADVSGLNLSDPEVRLSLQLALRARRLLDNGARD
jgi:purine catabolism regulator